jgi:hypothetical protein
MADPGPVAHGHGDVTTPIGTADFKVDRTVIRLFGGFDNTFLSKD